MDYFIILNILAFTFHDADGGRMGVFSWHMAGNVGKLHICFINSYMVYWYFGPVKCRTILQQQDITIMPEIVHKNRVVRRYIRKIPDKYLGFAVGV